MENIHTMAKKYPYGYEKKFLKIFDFRDMPCHKYFEWLVPCLLSKYYLYDFKVGNDEINFQLV